MLALMLCGCRLEILNRFLKGPFILVLHWARDLYGQSCMESLLTLLSEFKKKRASPSPAPAKCCVCGAGLTSGQPEHDPRVLSGSVHKWSQFIARFHSRAQDRDRAL